MIFLLPLLLPSFAAAIRVWASRTQIPGDFTPDQAVAACAMSSVAQAENALSFTGASGRSAFAAGEGPVTLPDGTLVADTWAALFTPAAAAALTAIQPAGAGQSWWTGFDGVDCGGWSGDDMGSFGAPGADWFAAGEADCAERKSVLCASLM